MGTFRLGINMEGAISAGAYTAGVLDFLTEALDAWYKAKASGEDVPMHDISIEVFTGASAGGMCAAISSVMLQEDFEHIHDITKTGTTNRFYESWVNKIDIQQMLQSDDLKGSKTVVSLLDSSIIKTIAGYALTPARPLPPPRPYVSPNLTLFLSLTNLRGIPYSLNGEAPGSIEESTFFYGDHIRFQTSRAGTGAAIDGRVRTLDLTQDGAAGGWDVLQTAAMATGAFPVFLAPRELERYGSEYMPAPWQPVTADATTGVEPSFPEGFKHPFVTLNVDGGVTNNNPFNLAHDFLASFEPRREDGRNNPDPKDADRAVLTIAPFPTVEPWDPTFNPDSASIFSALPKLFSALISQSRFFGESLSDIMTGATFSRFVIAPSEDASAGKTGKKRQPALQCAALGAFGGFFERGFRAHDYALGRRNCQKFLESSFVLPPDNAVMESGLDALGPEGSARREAVKKRFCRPAPGTYGMTADELKQRGGKLPASQHAAGASWLPIIPLCGDSVTAEVKAEPRAKITDEKLDLVVKLILARFRDVMSRLIDVIPSWMLRDVLRVGQPMIRLMMKGPLKKALIRNWERITRLSLKEGFLWRFQ